MSEHAHIRRTCRGRVTAPTYACAHVHGHSTASHVTYYTDWAHENAAACRCSPRRASRKSLVRSNGSHKHTGCIWPQDRTRMGCRVKLRENARTSRGVVGGWRSHLEIDAVCDDGAAGRVHFNHLRHGCGRVRSLRRCWLSGVAWCVDRRQMRRSVSHRFRKFKKKMPSAPHQSGVLTVIGSQVLVEPPQTRSDVVPHSRDQPPGAELTAEFVVWWPLAAFQVVIDARTRRPTESDLIAA